MLISPKTGVRAGLTTSAIGYRLSGAHGNSRDPPPPVMKEKGRPWTRACRRHGTFTSRVLPEPTDEPAGTAHWATTTVVSAERSCSAAYAKPTGQHGQDDRERRCPGRQLAGAAPSWPALRPLKMRTVAGREVRAANCSVRSMGHHHRQNHRRPGKAPAPRLHLSRRAAAQVGACSPNRPTNANTPRQ